METKQEASPRPWHMYKDDNGYCVAQDTGNVRAFNTAVTGWGCVTQSRANAALIVRAVNAHDALVIAAKKSLTCASLNSDVRALVIAALKLADVEWIR